MNQMRTVLSRLVHELHEKANMRLQLDYLSDNSVFAIMDSISLPKTYCRRKNQWMTLTRQMKV